MNSSKRILGFTFVELVVVVAIFSVILLFTMPLFKNLFVSSASRPKISNLINQIEMLKQKSVRMDKDFFLHIETYSGRVWISDETMDTDELDIARESGMVYDGKVSIVNIEFFDDHRTGEQASVIRFYRQGYSDRALIHLRQDDEDFTLKVGAFLNQVEKYLQYISYDDCI